MTQLEIPLARNSDPHTSHIAAAKVERFRCSHEAAIYEAMRFFEEWDKDGLHYRHIAELAGLEPVAVARRLVAMERRKLITRRRDEVTGKYLTRDNMALWFRA